MRQQPLDLFLHTLQPAVKLARFIQRLQAELSLFPVVGRLFAEQPQPGFVVCASLFHRHWPAQGESPSSRINSAFSACTLDKGHPRRYTTQPRRLCAFNNPPRLWSTPTKPCVAPCPRGKGRLVTEALVHSHTSCRNHTGRSCCQTSLTHRHAETLSTESTQRAPS